MIDFTANLMLDVSILIWFTTTLVQVTLLASATLISSRLALKNPAARHAIFATGLVLILVSPMSAYVFQRTGLGLLSVGTATVGDRLLSGSPNGDLLRLATRDSAFAGRMPANFDQQVKTGEKSTDATRPTAAASQLNARFLNDGSLEPNLSQLTQQERSAGLTSWSADNYATLRIIGSLLCLAWLFGSVICLIRWIVATLRLSKIIRNSVAVCSHKIESAFRAACEAVGCESKISEVRVSSDVSTPIVAGVFTPKILLPEDLYEQISVEPMTEIFVHELAHVIRRDQYFLVLQNLVRSLFWAHPLVLHVNSRLTRASEEVCDNFVLVENGTTSYSRTLLQVAQLCSGRSNPLGSIGVVGSGWSLRERIAGLLDGRRVLATSVSHQGKIGTVVLAVAMSSVLLATINLDNAAAVAQRESLADDLNEVESTDDWVRGEGDNLEFRLRGRLIGGVAGTPQSPQVEVKIHEHPHPARSLPVSITGDQYEVWIPAKTLRWFSLSIVGTSEDGRVAVAGAGGANLRSAMVRGMDLEFQRPVRTLNLKVLHQQQAVASAKVKTLVSGPGTGVLDTFATTDANGEVEVGIIAGGKLLSVTAWSDSRLLGGYQFTRLPARDPSASELVIEMVECGDRKTYVVDELGEPVAGVGLTLSVATPLPRVNYFGNPIGSEVVTDETGTATYRWFPKIGEAYHYAELKDERWVLTSQSNSEDGVEVVVARPAERVLVKGSVSRGGQYVGGVLVEASSFQAETEGHRDVRYAMTDQDGNFAFDALPNSTYSVFVLDDRWVSEPQNILPVDAKTEEITSPHLVALDGHPVTIQVTSGKQRAPIAGQAVSLRSPISVSWFEDGVRKNGSSARDTWVMTNRDGLAVGYVPRGELKASVYSSTWRSEAEIVVSPGEENRVQLHQENAVSSQVVGRLIGPRDGAVDFGTVTIKVQAVDGQLGDEFTPQADEAGRFEVATKATAVGCFAISADGKYAGSALITDFSQPFDLSLLPTGYVTGQLINEDGKGIASYPVTATSAIRNREPGIRTTGFSTNMTIITSTKTDKNGNYRIGPLPRLTEVTLTCAALADSAPLNARYLLEQCYLKLNEQRPASIHRLGSSQENENELTTSQRVERIMRDAQLGEYHVIAILTDYSDTKCREFVDRYLLDYQTDPNVGNFMQYRIDTGDGGSGQGKVYARERAWPIPPAGDVVAVAIDAAGNELGRLNIDVSVKESVNDTRKFLATHSPAVVDGYGKWDDAFALAGRTNRRVWVRISQRYCAPCLRLNRWLDDHRELLGKEFVMLKIDDVRDRHGRELAEQVTAGRRVGVPFFAFYDAEGQVLVDSYGPTGNIGFMLGYESKLHFRKMLDEVCQVLSDDEINQLIDSLGD
ncbi:M56 family metallopeptidase [Planctomycetaceae bacterium SH139]